MPDERRSQQATLGCGTLILVGLVVLIFTRPGVRELGDEIQGLRQDVHRLRSEVSDLESLTRRLRSSVDELQSLIKAQSREIQSLRGGAAKDKD